MKEQLNPTMLPEHLAIIMDGNGRWAKKQGAMRVFGHQSAVKSVRETIEGCAELGIKYLTLYAFSTENWNRPKREVDALMKLLVKTIRKEIETLQKNNIKLLTIGNTNDLPKTCQKELHEAMEITRQNTGLQLVLALSYSGRWDILQAVQSLAQEVQDGNITAEKVSAAFFEKFLNTKSIPDPELLIRTSGEMRISNFFLWQLAYTELYVTPVLWPDFRKEHLYEALWDYQGRERRFGKTSEQIKKEA